MEAATVATGVKIAQKMHPAIFATQKVVYKATQEAIEFFPQRPNNRGDCNRTCKCSSRASNKSSASTLSHSAGRSPPTTTMMMLMMKMMMVIMMTMIHDDDDDDDDDDTDY
jgi:hypothetical protein